MKTENEIKEIITENLIYYRKLHHLTQIELAQALNYSDKAISKWERGESIPDVYILMQIVDIYGITINDLVSPRKVAPKKSKALLYRYILFLSIGLAWFITTLLFVVLKIFNTSWQKAWLLFIYVIPLSSIIGIVFGAIWQRKIVTCLWISLLAWSIPLCISLSFNNPTLWLLFVCVVPFQILIILWFVMSKKKKNN